MSNDRYKAAYERQKLARKKSDKLLEDQSRRLYESNNELRSAYQKLKEQREQLYHQEKLASVGMLAAGVAHEINNPSGFIKSNLNTLKKYMESLTAFNQQIEETVFMQDDKHQATIIALKAEHDIDYIQNDLQDIINESLDGISRIENIVQNLKSFSRPDVNDEENIDINKCVTTTLNLARSHTKHKAEIITHLNSRSHIRGKESSINQVILNLITNAIHAIDNFGTITVTTTEKDGLIILDIHDTGCGIDENDLPSIFDPFFTTKDLDVGTGLGLSVSHGIIKQHKGHIKVDTKVGEGTTFSLDFPVARNELTP